MGRIDELRSEAEWANKKFEHQKFELERVYELLRDKKMELDQCYRDLASGKKNNKTSPGQGEDDSQLKSLLKSRR